MQEEERLRPPNFNIFFALGHEYREVSTHSAMLAHLLDPLASHAQKILFLRRFLDIVKKRQGTKENILSSLRRKTAVAGDVGRRSGSRMVLVEQIYHCAVPACYS
jgi:hypothetical protein